MPKKLVQKQRQKQSVTVNISLAKSKARAKSKSSKKSKNRNKGSVMILPPPIYSSPIQNLIPQAFSKDAKQIIIPTLEEQMKDFLKKQEHSSTKKKLQSQIDDELDMLIDEQKVAEHYKKAGLKPPPENMTDYNARFQQNIPIPFKNEEKTYLKASEPDYEKNAPKFSDKPAETITEFLRRPDKRPPVRVYLEEESISYQGTPATRASGTPASQVNIIPFEDEMSSMSSFSSDSVNTLNPYPKNIYNKMMGLNLFS